MKAIYQPLKDKWKVDEDSSIPVQDQILERVSSEDWFTTCRGWEILKAENISGKLGRPMLHLIPQEFYA